MSRPILPAYKTRNWPAYNEALKRRGSLAIWFDPAMTWEAAPTGKRGRQPDYSDAAIQTCLTMKVLFGMALRQTTGLAESLLRLIGLDWDVPDFSTLSRRQKTLKVTREPPIPETVSLHIPFCVVKRGGRKEMQMPEGSARPRKIDSALVKALARAFRWKRMLESGEYATTTELAEREGIAPSYMTRVLRLTLLAPDIVEAILDGNQGPEVTLARLLEPVPVEWSRQPSSLLTRRL